MSNRIVNERKTQLEAVARKSTGMSGLVDVLVFLIPCLWFVQFRIVGVLSGSDILCISTFLYLTFRLQFRIATSAGKWLIILCLLWLASQIVTDVIRHTAFRDYARGWSNIGMTIAYLAVLSTLLSGRPQRIVIFGWGLVLGSLLAFFISPNEFVQVDPWKFGLASPVTFAVFLLASRKQCSSSFSFFLIIGMGAVNIVLGARSLGGICLAAAMYLVLTRIMRRNLKGDTKLKPRTQFAIAVSIVLGIAGVIWVYEFAAGSGILGDAARDKYELQASGKYGMLLGGRVEMLGSVPAIYDSPILGHGSYPRDAAYLLAARQALAMMDYKDADNQSKEELAEGYIPMHSYILGAWVSAGILGAVFWAAVLVLILRGLMRVYPASVALLPLVSFMAFALFWGILFSPFGAEERMTSSYCIVLLMTCMAMAPSAAERKVAVARKRPAKSSSGVKLLRQSEQT
jgi:O-antigen ligase